MWRRRYRHALTLYQPQMVNSHWLLYGMDSGGDCGVNVANSGVGVPASGVVLSGGRYLRTNCGANQGSDEHWWNEQEVDRHHRCRCRSNLPWRWLSDLTASPRFA